MNLIKGLVPDEVKVFVAKLWTPAKLEGWDIIQFAVDLARLVLAVVFILLTAEMRSTQQAEMWLLFLGLQAAGGLVKMVGYYFERQKNHFELGWYMLELGLVVLAYTFIDEKLMAVLVVGTAGMGMAYHVYISRVLEG